MRQHVGHGIVDLLLDQLCLGFGNRKIMAFALIGGQAGEQNDGKQRQDN